MPGMVAQRALFAAFHAGLEFSHGLPPAWEQVEKTGLRDRQWPDNLAGNGRRKSRVKSTIMKQTALTFSLLLTLLSGCSENTKKAPPKEQIQDSIRNSLPAFLTVENISTEAISTGDESVKVNFKASIIPKETLYELERKINGTPPIILLHLTQAAGMKATIYGSLEARRMIDKWSLSLFEIQSGVEQFGRPKGSFGAQAFVTGSPEADAAIKLQSTNAEQEERARKAMIEKQEKERQAMAERQEKERQDLEEQRKREEQAAKQKLLDATTAGTSYLGTIAYEGQRQRVRLIFTEQNNFLLHAEATNPDKAGEGQAFTGEFVINPQRDENSKFAIAYSILFSATGKQTPAEGRWEFYEQEGRMGLNVTDSGIEGEATTEGTLFNRKEYTIRLQRETKESQDRERQHKATAEKRRADEEEIREKAEAIADDKAKGVARDPTTGELAENSAYVHNRSTRAARFQLLTERGWETKTIKSNETLFIQSNCDLKVRWLEGAKYKKDGLTAWHQPHLSFNGVRPDEMRRNAPTNDLTIDDEGHYSFEVGKP